MNIQLIMKPGTFLFLCCLFTLSIFLKFTFAQNSSPTLVYPKNNVFLSDTTVYLQWNLFPNSSSYHLQIATDSLFNDTTLDKLGIANTIDTVNLFPNDKYYWRVRADTGAGFSYWSATFNFKIFNPLDLTDLRVWLKGDSVTLNGSTVQTWEDQSGNNNHAEQPTASKK